MDAVAYLTEQHREIQSLFDQVESAARATPARRLCRKLFDLIAVHAAIEEMIFYPAAGAAGVEELLPRAFERHVSAERLVGDVVAAGGAGAPAAAKLAVLKERKRQHAEEEERELFPRVRGLLSAQELEVLGARLEAVADQLLEPGVGAWERIVSRRCVA